MFEYATGLSIGFFIGFLLGGLIVFANAFFEKKQ